MIYWELLLGSEDPCGQITRLYTEMKSANVLAEYLGVSRTSVVMKLRECGVKMRGRGGGHVRMDRDLLPDKWWYMSTEDLVHLTGYSSNYVRRLRRKKLCSLEESIKVAKAGLSSSIKPSISRSDGSEEEQP